MMVAQYKKEAEQREAARDSLFVVSHVLGFFFVLLMSILVCF